VAEDYFLSDNGGMHGEHRLCAAATQNLVPGRNRVMAEYSLSPSGEKFPLPAKEDYATEYHRLEGLAAQARQGGLEVVVVMGLGFVGAVMAAIVADSTDKRGKPTKFVIGCQRPSTRSYWKTPLLNRGISPVKAEDPEVDPMIARCVLEKKTLIATYNGDCLKLADCVVVDVQCDYAKQELGNMRTGQTDMAALEATSRRSARGSRSTAWFSSRRPSHPGRPNSSPGRSSRRRSPPAVCGARRCSPTASNA